MIFRNISSHKIEAYGYVWLPEQEIDVTDTVLIRKFQKYPTLKPDLHAEKADFDTMKKAAVDAGMKVDGRWSDKRLVREVEMFVGSHNGYKG